MARKSTSRPWTRIAIVGGILAVLFGTMLGTGHTSPKLGLDLQGGTTVTLKPKAINGAKVTSAQLNKAVDIIRQRVNGFGVAEADVVKQGTFIIISVPGKDSRSVVEQVGKTARLTFREVANEAAAAPEPVASPSVSANPSAKPGASASPKASSSATIAPSPSSTASKRVISSALLAASPAPAVTPNPVATTAITPNPLGTAAPTTTTGGDTAPAQIQAEFQANATCSQYNSLAADATDNSWVVACDRTSHFKFLLKPAKVVGTDVKGASATVGSNGQVITGEWQVNIQFKNSAFQKLTAATVNKQVAIMLDGVVQSAPTIQQEIAGDAQITGTFTQREANDLANVLKYGALPLTFEKSQVQSVSATLGKDSLHAGLLAGGLGIILVLLYCFLYYRAMGIITVLSLLVSGLMVFGSVCVLGDLIGFTLTLAGIAGLIVSIGITADSFVVFYERLKDEVRDGRTPRSSVDRGWVRARRTILSADTVSFLAAMVLYLLSVGSVKGFAFTLGLSTLLDLVVVFLFTKPLMDILVKIPLFSTSRWSGLTSVAASGVASRRSPNAPKEA